VKKIAAFLVAGLILLLAGCSRKEAVETDYAATAGGQDIVISFLEGTKSEGTITAENGTYSFSYSMDGTLSIIYPNGYTYSQKDMNGGIASSWPYAETAEELGYIDGFSLAWSISSAPDGNASTKTVPVIVSLLIIAAGIWFACSPKSIWWLSRGWWYKNAEPSDLGLVVYRLIGCILAFVGIISFFA